MKELLCNTPLFGIVLCTGAYLLGQWIDGKCGHRAWSTPALLSMVLCAAALLVFDIPLEWFNQGGDLINLLLGPATAMLALPIYNQRKVLKQNFWPVAVGCAAGCVANALSVTLLCRVFGLSDLLTHTLLPKSVTTPIALALCGQAGGVPSITVAAVMLTGALGMAFAPTLVKVFRLQDPVQVGVAIGTSSHVIGTSRAMELGEIQGAMSSVSVGVAGLFTVALALVW